MKINTYRAILEQMWQKDKKCFAPDAEFPPLCLRCGKPLNRRPVVNALSHYTTMRLKDIATVAVNNDECVILKVKEGHEMDLIALGCFSGDETMLRLTKGADVTYTAFRKNGQSVSRDWGRGGYTLVSNSVCKMGRQIQHCIEKDFGIKCEL